MTTMKIAVSLPEETLERAKRAVRRGRAESLSAYVNVALEQKATLDELDDLLNEMLDETGGSMTHVERRRIDRLLAGPRRRPRKSR
jgi:Arc/MetJ-type ribon-helix-helix transcriptional regulator